MFKYEDKRDLKCIFGKSNLNVLQNQNYQII